MIPPSAYNAFSRVDVRVEVKIPGGVEAYVVDPRGERHAPTPAIWTEVYLTSALRAILYADDPNYKIAGFRKLDPIKTLEDEVRFISAADTCYAKGARRSRHGSLPPTLTFFSCRLVTWVRPRNSSGYECLESSDVRHYEVLRRLGQVCRLQ